MGNKSYAELLAEVTEMHNKMEALQVELRAAKERGEAPPSPHPRWGPENGERYYYLDCDGWIECSETISLEYKKYKAEIGNLFKSVEEARIAVDRLKVLTEMREWAGKWNDRYVIAVNPCDNTKIDVFARCILWPSGEMRFATEEDAKNCIKAVGADRIIKYYFQIPE